MLEVKTDVDVLFSISTPYRLIYTGSEEKTIGVDTYLFRVFPTTVFWRCFLVYFWKKSRLDAKNRVLLPKDLRNYLRLNGKKEILWISATKKESHGNEFILEVGVKQ